MIQYEIDQYEIDIEVSDPTNKIKAMNAMREMCSPQLGLKESKDIIEAAIKPLQFPHNHQNEFYVTNITIVTSNTQLVMALLMWLVKNKYITSETTRVITVGDIRRVESSDKPTIYI
jgi:hypothetical protein